MKKLSIIALALASLTCFAACAQQINFDADYILAEQEKCNLAPLNAVEARCKSERAGGKEFKPGCEALDHVKMVNSNEEMAAFFSSSVRNKVHHCPK